MFSEVQENYVKGLISSYAKQGYDYYVCHSVVETNNDYDVYIYFSKEEIKAITSLTFDVSNSIFIKIDTSSRSSYSGAEGNRVLVSDSNYSGIVSVNEAEFVYTNASIGYDVTSLVVNPDITMNNSASYVDSRINYLTCVFVVIFFIYIFIRSFF